MMQINNKSNATLAIAILTGTNSPKGQTPSWQGYGFVLGNKFSRRV
jgi:hypothetical protein